MTEKLQNHAVQTPWKRILVPINLKTSSKAVLKTAFEIARWQKSELFVLHVAYDPIMQSEAGSGTFSLSEDWPREQARKKRLLDRLVAEHLGQLQCDLPITNIIVKGNTEHWILEIAREKKIDLIVLGHDEEYTLDRFFLWRNVDRIVDHAGCSVLIIRLHLFQEEKHQEAVLGESVYAVGK